MSAYTFIDWNICIDPNGNTRILDWSEAGMRDAPSGLYLEVLKEAATLRYNAFPVGTGASNYIPGYAMQLLPNVLEFIDAQAWEVASDPMDSGWILSSNRLSDYTGIYTPVIPGELILTSAPVPVLTSVSDLLTEIGDSTRIPIPSHILGRIDGAWMRQVKKCFLAKTQTSSGPYSAARWVGEVRTGAGSSFSAAEAAWNSASWAPVSSPDAAYYTAQHTVLSVPLYTMINRLATTVLWNSIDHPLVSSKYAKHCDLYGYGYIANMGTTFECVDYPLLDQCWSRIHIDMDLTETAKTEEIGKIGTITAGLNKSWQLVHQFVVSDWGQEWVL